jgi:hypothetical protein
VSTDITVKTSIRVNGKHYASVEDMPADVRHAYERALSMSGGNTHSLLTFASSSGNAQVATVSRIVINGQEYATVDQMPADVRRLYDGIVATLEADQTPGASAAAVEAGQAQCQRNESRAVAGEVALTAGTVRPESAISVWRIATAVIVGLLLGSLLFGR